VLKNKVDAIVFSGVLNNSVVAIRKLTGETGGIGEKSSALRADIAKQLDYLGVEVHRQRNGADSEDVVLKISSEDSKITLLRVLTDEEASPAMIGLVRANGSATIATMCGDGVRTREEDCLKSTIT